MIVVVMFVAIVKSENVAAVVIAVVAIVSIAVVVVLIVVVVLLILIDGLVSVVAIEGVVVVNEVIGSEIVLISSLSLSSQIRSELIGLKQQRALFHLAPIQLQILFVTIMKVRKSVRFLNLLIH